MTKRSPTTAHPPAQPDARSALSTPERILLAAEQLFSERGVDGVSLREITSTSGVNSAAAHYHFGSKLAVLEQLFELRAKPIAEQRLALLSELRYNRQGRPVLEDVLRAFLRPALEALSTPEGIAFTRLRARLSFEMKPCADTCWTKPSTIPAGSRWRPCAKPCPSYRPTR